ncbi:MAG: metal-dependent hydrolase [Capnocytophaga sp.]|nr:metal-dependent hydrolase [Capnocytophaga sp.]
MEITYYGHSCVGIRIGDANLLIDPFISGNPFANHINTNQIKADYILISAAHQDHTMDVESIAKRTKAKIISNFEIVEYYYNLGIDGHPMNLGGSYEFPFGYVKLVPALHSSTFPDGKSGGCAGGFVIKTAEKTIYFSGNTALHFDMQLIPVRYRIDLAILPIGSNFTMDVEDAIIASDFVKCDKVLGVNFNTFPSIKIDVDQAKYSFKAKGKDLLLLDIGRTISF